MNTTVGGWDDGAIDRAIEEGGIGQWSLDLASGALAASPVFRRMLGWPIDTPVTEDDLLSAVHDDDRERFVYRMSECLDSHEPFQLSHRMFTAGGGTLPIETRGLAIFGIDGRALRVAAASVNLDRIA